MDDSSYFDNDLGLGLFGGSSFENPDSDEGEESDIDLPEADFDSEVQADPVHRRNTWALKDKLAQNTIL